MLFDKLKSLLSHGGGAEEKPAVRAAGEAPAVPKAQPDETVVSRLNSLTKRERELLLLLLEGCTLKESAARLNVKYSTANTHMTSLYKKLSVSSRPELIIRYRDAALQGLETLRRQQNIPATNT